GRRKVPLARQKDRSPSPPENLFVARPHACSRFLLPTPRPFAWRAGLDFDELRSAPARHVLGEIPGAPLVRGLWARPSQHRHLLVERWCDSKLRSHARRAAFGRSANSERSAPRKWQASVCLRAQEK